MANFTFLQSEPEYSSFAQACIEAENRWKDSPSSCVAGCRTALETMVKWLYQRDKRLNFTHSKVSDGGSVTDLYNRMESESFKAIVPEPCRKELTQIRQLANKVLHENYSVTPEDAMRCLNYLFDFAVWLDRSCGKNISESRTFSQSDVPKGSSTFRTWLTHGAAFVGGFIFGRVSK